MRCCINVVSARAALAELLQTQAIYAYLSSRCELLCTDLCISYFMGVSEFAQPATGLEPIAPFLMSEQQLRHSDKDSSSNAVVY